MEFTHDEILEFFYRAAIENGLLQNIGVKHISSKALYISEYNLMVTIYDNLCKDIMYLQILLPINNNSNTILT